MRRFLVLGLVAVVTLAATTPALAERRSGFALNVHAHSTEFGAPSGASTLYPTTPLAIPVTEASASYSAIPCEVPAPFNDRSLTFNPEYPGLDSPASTRSLLELTVTEMLGDPERGQSGGRVQGTLTTLVCLTGDEIFIDFEGTFDARAANELVFHRATFEITGGTGEFADLEGEGKMTGSLRCLPIVLANNDAADCVELGAYSDAVFELRGTFSDPTMPGAG